MRCCPSMLNLMHSFSIWGIGVTTSIFNKVVFAYMPFIVHSKHVINLWCTCAGLHGHPSCICSMLSIYYAFKELNGKINFVHLMQFRSLDVYSESKSVALRGISNSNTSNHHETKRKLFAKDFAATIAKLKLWQCTWISISRFESLSNDLWCNRIAFDTLRAQQGYNGILYYLLIIWSFSQIKIVVIFLTISGHTACYLQQWYIRC